MALSKYFRFPFGLTGDRASIPDAVQPSGEVSFEEGYSIDYQLNPATDPSAKNIERDKANQLYYDITQALKEYQEFGAPYFIEAAQNGGVAFSYKKYALVRYDIDAGITPVFQSLVEGNTALPTDTANWKMIIGADPYIFENAVFEASVANGEIVYWDNANNRFDEAIADGTAAQNAVGMADVTNARVYLFGAIPSGVISGLSANVAYYLSTSTPGAITSVIPTTNVVHIGTSKSATTFVLNITPAPTSGTTPAQFDNDNSLATTAFVKRQGLQSRGFSSSSVSITLDDSHVGGTFFFGGLTAGQTVTLPVAAALPAGARITIINTNSQSIVVAPNGSDTIYQGIATIANITMRSKSSLVIEKQSASQWMVVSLNEVADPASSLIASGYQKLPSGLIIQWGSSAITAPASNVTFPIAFPTNCFQVVACDLSAPGSLAYFGVDSFTTTTFLARTSLGSGGDSCRFVAVGY